MSTTENRTDTATRTVVVVGHGMVGHRFVEALRSRDTDSTWKVVVLSEEAEAAYDRVGLSSYVGAWDRASLALAGNTYAGDDLVDLRLGTRAEHVDRDARTVTTSAGEVIAYDALVLATGLLPVRAAGARARLDGLLRLPHPRRPRRHPRRCRGGDRAGRGRGPRGERSRRRRRTARAWRPPTRCACSA